MTDRREWERVLCLLFHPVGWSGSGRSVLLALTRDSSARTCWRTRQLATPTDCPCRWPWPSWRRWRRSSTRRSGRPTSAARSGTSRRPWTSATSTRSEAGLVTLYRFVCSTHGHSFCFANGRRKWSGFTTPLLLSHGVNISQICLILSANAATLSSPRRGRPPEVAKVFTSLK